MEIKAYVLLAEDDYNFGTTIKKRLEESGYHVTHCLDGETAWKEFSRRTYDICLLDIVMPKKSGFSLAKLIRQKNDLIPIIFLTAKSEDQDKISGFKHGADDYLTKPFGIQELVLRMEVFLRRTKPLNANKKSNFLIGTITFEYGELRLTDKSGNIIAIITQKEADLLKFFCEHANKILKREEILFNVWGKDDYFLGRSMDVFITKIRKHLAGEKNVKLETLHGVGFRFHVPTINHDSK